MKEGIKIKRDWLANYRKEKKLTHQEVAEKVNISRQYYGFIENGERTPSVPIAKRLGKLFGFDWTIFFEDDCYKSLHSNKEVS